MAKLTLTDIAAGYALIATVNNNNALVEAAMEKTVFRDGTTPNTMSAALDLNSNKITNLTDGTANQDAATKSQLDAVVAGTGGLANLVEDVSPELGADLDGKGFDILGGGVITLEERANSLADIAGRGQIWVKNTTPSELWFTDDAGTDTKII